MRSIKVMKKIIMGIHFNDIIEVVDSELMVVTSWSRF